MSHVIGNFYNIESLSQRAELVRIKNIPLSIFPELWFELNDGKPFITTPDDVSEIRESPLDHGFPMWFRKRDTPKKNKIGSAQAMAGEWYDASYTEQTGPGWFRKDVRW
jgi:hypothetical protein